MQTSLTAVEFVVKPHPEGSRQFVQLAEEEFAEVDHAYDLVTIWHGRRTGDERDWGYPVASVPLSFLVTIAGAVQAA